MQREKVWVGGEGGPGSRLVVVATSSKTQSVNICTGLNEAGTYEVTYVIMSPDPYMTPRDVGSCRTVEALVEKIQRHNGFKRDDPSPPEPDTSEQN